MPLMHNAGNSEAMDDSFVDVTVSSISEDSHSVGSEPRTPAVEPTPQTPTSVNPSSAPSSPIEIVHETAAMVIKQTRAPFLKYGDSLKSDYAPFESEQDWELARWLHQSGLSQSKINAYFKLPLPHISSVRTGVSISKNIGKVPYPGPQWQWHTLDVQDGTPSEPVVLMYRDPLEAIRYLFSRPSLYDAMEFAPRKVLSESGDRFYSEMSTARWWWRTQDALPDKTGFVAAVLLGSDSCHLTQFSGGKKAWPLYLSLGNIKSQVRNKPSSRAWMLIAYIPHVLFVDDPAIRTTLLHRVYHRCLEIVLEPLIRPGNEGVLITDAKGDVRLGFPLVAGHLADLVEQQLIGLCPKYSSPYTVAHFHDLESPEERPLRTRKWILTRIKAACDKADPSDVAAYQKVAASYYLTGVHLPFWRNLPRYCPELCVCPDLLHGVLRFWRDHVLQWGLNLIGREEYDRRLRCIQPVSGYRQFPAGIQHLSQWTGREDRELLRTHVAILCGFKGVPPTAIKNQRAFADFTYLTQYHSHNATTLAYIEEALRDFHATKNIYITLGARKGKKGVIEHFNIPKLRNLLQFIHHIQQMGSSPQYSTEIVESLHRTFAKAPYSFTNGKDHVPQMCRRLDREERIAHREEFLQWREEQARQSHLHAIFSHYTPRYRHILAERYQDVLLEHEHERPIPVKTRVLQSRLWLAIKPHKPRQELSAVATEYRLADFSRSLQAFLFSQRRAGDDPDDLHVRYVDVWRKLRIRAPDVQDYGQCSQEHVLHADPPSPAAPFGLCHCVLVHTGSEAQPTGIEGYLVAQVRVLFRIHLQDANHPLQHQDLAYVQYFTRPQEKLEARPNMYVVSRQDTSDGIRQGEVIKLDSIARFVQLVPKFGAQAHSMLTSSNSMDICRDYYLNSFADKEIYQSVY